MDTGKISLRIKALCKQKKIAIKTLLEDCGINRNFIYALEKNEQSPSSEKLLKIADYLDISLDYLVGRDASSYTGSVVSLPSKGIKKALSLDEEERVYSLMKAANLLETKKPDDDQKYLDVRIAARGGDKIQTVRVTKEQAERAKKIAEQLPDEPTP